MRSILEDVRANGELYEVAYIDGPGPKWGHKVIFAASIDKAIEKVNAMGLDARSAWTYTFED